MVILGVPPHPRQKSEIPRKMYEKKKDIIPIKEKFRQKGIKTKKSFLIRKNLLNRNAIKRKNMGIRGYFEAPKAPRKFFGVKH